MPVFLSPGMECTGNCSCVASIPYIPVDQVRADYAPRLWLLLRSTSAIHGWSRVFSALPPSLAVVCRERPWMAGAAISRRSPEAAGAVHRNCFRQLLLRCSTTVHPCTCPGSFSIPSQRPLLSCSAMCRKFFSLSGWMAPLFIASMSAQPGSLRWVQLLNWQFPR